MTFWLDPQLSPGLATWWRQTFSIDCVCVRDLGLRDAADRQIFDAARRAGAIIVTKDVDFVRLVERLGLPPQIVWVTCGNTSNAALRALLVRVWGSVTVKLNSGEAVVELNDESR